MLSGKILDLDKLNNEFGKNNIILAVALILFYLIKVLTSR
jgi:hypothetical protein